MTLIAIAALVMSGRAQTTVKATTGTYGVVSTFGNTSVLVGSAAGNAASTGVNNSFIGYESGKVNTIGANNVFLGYRTGLANISGGSNTFVGSESGSANTTNNNSFFGYQAGKVNTTGGGNTFVGYKTGLANITGISNTFLGSSAGIANTGSYNTFIGNGSGSSNTSGSNNVYVGGNSGGANNTNTSHNTVIGGGAGWITGSYNICIGENAGTPLDMQSLTGTGNVLIGNNAASYENPISNKLYISNQLSSSPLIWGDFTLASRSVKLNGKTGIGMPSESFPTVVGGTNIPSYNLFVRGGILADEVRVRTTWSDYVFESDYKLPTLEEVEKHIKEKGYLINVPSGKTVETDGIEVGQMAKIQQEKIEELTLYVIEQNKINKRQAQEIAELKAMVEVLASKK